MKGLGKILFQTYNPLFTAQQLTSKVQSWGNKPSLNLMNFIDANITSNKYSYFKRLSFRPLNNKVT
jgi:hypothetical protein